MYVLLCARWDHVICFQCFTSTYSRRHATLFLSAPFKPKEPLGAGAVWCSLALGRGLLLTRPDWAASFFKSATVMLLYS